MQRCHCTHPWSLKTALIKEHRNLSEENRFTILYDKLHNLAYGGIASETSDTVTQAASIQNFVMYKAVNIPLEFSSTTGAITEIRSNNIGCLVISDIGTCGFQGNVRLRFSDR